MLVHSACEVQLTDRNQVEKSGRKTVPSTPLNINAARNHSQEHYGKTQLHFEVEHGQSIKGSFEVNDIGKTNFSVAQLVDTSNQLIFSNKNRR